MASGCVPVAVARRQHYTQEAFVHRAVVLTTLVLILLAAAGVAMAGSGGDSSVSTTPEDTSSGATAAPGPETAAPGGASSEPEAAGDASEPTVTSEPTVGETGEPTAAEPVEETPAPDAKASRVGDSADDVDEPASGMTQNNGKGVGKPEERESGAGQQKVALCHKGKNTITVGKPAQAAHLRHGDTVGPCQSEGAASEPSEENPGKGMERDGDGGGGDERQKVTLCHKGHTITVGELAEEAHLRHGDSPGAC